MTPLPRATASGNRRPGSGIDIDVERLMELRYAKGWERRDLARETGLSMSTIRKIETRDRRPRAHALKALCDALGCEPADLLVSEKRTA